MAYTVVRSIISPSMAKSGTGSTSPTGGQDDLLTSGSPVKFTPDVTMINIRHHNSSFTKRVGIPARRVWNIALQAYMQGSGSAGTTTINGFKSLYALLQASAMYGTAVAGGTITLTPATIAQLTACEIWGENNGLLHKAQDCVGNCVLEGVPTDGMKLNWTGQGTYAEPTVATISGFTGGTDRSEPFLNIAGTVISATGTYTPVVSRITFDRGLRISEVEDANATTGVKQAFIADGEPTLTCVFAMDSDSTAANITYPKFFSDFLGKATHAVTFTLGTVVPNRVRFSIPQAQIRSIVPSEGRDYMLMTVTYGQTHTTNENEFAITIF